MPAENRDADAEARDAYVEAVLQLVECIPAGRVTTYGAIADIVGTGGPRQVGRALSLHGAVVPWWRVVRADGSLPPSHQRGALEHYRGEGTALRGDFSDAASLRVDLLRAWWQPEQAAQAAQPG
ncbi:MAG: MGMT family protein [Nocardioidaceae bacterium]